MKPQSFKTNRGFRGDWPVAGMPCALFVVNERVEAKATDSVAGATTVDVCPRSVAARVFGSGLHPEATR